MKEGSEPNKDEPGNLLQNKEELSSDELFKKFVQGIEGLKDLKATKELLAKKEAVDQEAEDKNLIRDYRIKIMKGDAGDKGIKGENGDKGLKGEQSDKGEKG